MFELSFALIFTAFVAGMLMFLAPCTLPLVPAYLAFISGIKTKVEGTALNRRLLIKNALFFVIGFSSIFILFGVLAGFFGSFLGQFKALMSQIGGLFIIVFALLMLNIINIDVLLKEKKFKLPKFFTPGHPLSALLIGMVFALGWTPCVGPILASILLLASTTASAFSGAVLLFIFSLGLAVPFILVAVMFGQASNLIEKYSYLSRGINVLGGIFLLIIGLLLLTNNFGLTAEYGYRLFDSLGLEFLFNYF